jgi:hypothetical protein
MSHLSTCAVWLIEFRAAEQILSGRNNARISHLADMIGQGNLKFGYHEKVLFKNSERVNIHVNEVNGCLVPFETPCASCARDIAGMVLPKKFKSNASQTINVSLVGTAVARNFGVLSSGIDGNFMSLHELCELCDVTTATPDQFFACLGI